MQKRVFIKKHRLRQGAGVLIAIGFLCISIAVTVIALAEDSIRNYRSVKTMTDSYRSRELALAGIQMGLLVLSEVETEYLYQYEVLNAPPRLLLSRSCSDNGVCVQHYVQYILEPEDGKLNANTLVRNDGQENQNQKQIFERLFEELDLDTELVTSLIDWIDEDSSEGVGGAEEDYYTSLSPARKIKNHKIQTMSELFLIKGFTNNIVYLNKPQAEYYEFLKNSEEEEGDAKVGDLKFEYVTEEDWDLSKHITAFTSDDAIQSEVINVNAAPFHVLLSLSLLMTPQIVGEILDYKSEKNGYIKNKSELEKIPSISRNKALRNAIIYKGTSGYLDTQSRFYKIRGLGYITVLQGGGEKELSYSSAHGLWDKKLKKFVYYSEN